MAYPEQCGDYKRQANTGKSLRLMQGHNAPASGNQEVSRKQPSMPGPQFWLDSSGQMCARQT